ncbi:hypothetical protein [Novosphingobium sp. AP12]|uniref:hypothetical protein n=1 Tax=Novosphingobium sp. AP12 TaxID=1144305 RepID=UPI0012F955E2|nr:hypothetical protein [Novosphingobium sp. AP12]
MSATPASRPSASPDPAPSVTPRATAASPEPRLSTPPSPVASDTPGAPAASEAAALPAPVDAAPIDAAESRQGTWPVWWWAGPLALLAAVGAIIAFLRRRKGAESPSVAEPEELAKPEQFAAPAVEVSPTPVLAASVASVPFEPVPVVPQPAFDMPESTPAASSATLSFEPIGLRLSLVYATLQYRLTITAGDDLCAANLFGDMIGAHASIPPEQQLAPALAALKQLKAVPPIAAGETVVLKGELQLPLSHIRPLQQGSASFFVPLVRLCLGDENGDVAMRRVFTVGIDGGAAALSPLRLDTGPQEHRQLASREVEAARGYPLQPDQRRAAG